MQKDDAHLKTALRVDPKPIVTVERRNRDVPNPERAEIWMVTSSDFNTTSSSEIQTSLNRMLV